LILVVGGIRVAAAHFRTSRLVGQWLQKSAALSSTRLITTFSPQGCTPPLLLYGIRRPRVLVSEEAVSLLNPEELQAAIRHEVSHIRLRDNLKKLILCGIPFPGTRTLERAWQESAEFAADQAAVSSGDEALSLAAALIKLCDLAPVQRPPAFTTGLVQLPALVNDRIHRLLAWNGAIPQSAKVRLPWLLILPTSAAFLIFSYGHALVLIHELTEWFIH
jgi:hypothetical protein